MPDPNASSLTDPQNPPRESFYPRNGTEYPLDQPVALTSPDSPIRPALPPSASAGVNMPRGALATNATQKVKKRTSPSWLWLFAQFTASLVTQIVDIIAPLLLVLGCAWALLPVFSRLATDALAEADAQTKELAMQVISQLPSHVRIAGISWSAFGIIAIALFLMIGSAFSVTWQAYLNKHSA